MNLKGELQALGARFDIEEAHVGHVANLAMNLFDGFAARDSIREDRTVLQTAAYLHDIGYAADPADHVEAGVRILLENPLSSFSSKDWAMVVGIVLLHRREWRAALDREMFTTMPAGRMERIQRLAAILRIADGLDHGRLQDVRITGCRRGKKNDRIAVVCGWYAGNIAWAEGKADLWEAVFKRHLRIEGAEKRPRRLFEHVVHPKDTAARAARRILYSQYDTMRDQLPAMRGESVVDGLHDYRVALRRFRTALKLFEPLMEKKSGCRNLEKRLGQLSDLLGPARDTHVLWLLCQKPGIAEELDAAFLENLAAEVAAANESLVGILDSAEVARTVLDMGRLLRVELPALERTHTTPLFKDHVKERLAELMRGISTGGLPAQDTAPERLHELRKRCRKARYYAEFVAPVCGKSMEKKARRLQRVASALGDIRDAQTHCERLQGAAGSTRLHERLAVLQAEGWERLGKGWDSLT